jgi:hypothetical protein
VKTGLTFLQAFRLASKRIVPFACGFAVLFTLCALAQYWFVTRQTRLTTKADLEAVAKRIEQEIAFTNSWNLNGWRRAEFAAGTYYVFTTDGFQIEIGEFTPGLVTHVALVDTAIYDGPKTVTTPVAETWRLLGKKVSGGSVLLGILDLEDDLKDLKSADETLRTEAAKFGSTIAEATKVRSRDISARVDYAVIGDSGDLQFSTSFVPLWLSSGPVLNAAAIRSPITVEGKSYLLYQKPILDGLGKAVGHIVIPKDVTAEQRAVRSLAFFNVGLGALCWLAVLLFVGGHIAASEIEKRNLEISLEEALRQGEGQTIEFKEGVSTQNLPPAISAFANTNAGIIFVGVRDNREVCGVIASTPQEEEQLKQKIRDVVQNHVDPLVIPDLRYYEHDGKKVIRLLVPLGDRPPYLGNGIVWRRVLAAVVPAKADDIRRMH